MEKRIYKEDIKKIVLTAEEVLIKFVDLAVGIFQYGDKGRIYRRSIHDYYKERDINKARLSQTLYELSKRKFISIYFEDKKKMIELTEKGKRKANRIIIEKMNLKIPKNWDKKWRIVVFDIPEQKKSARDALAGKLKYFGFLPIQESVFVFPYDCKEEIDAVKATYEIGPYVQYILADRIDTEINLIKHFFDKNLFANNHNK